MNETAHTPGPLVVEKTTMARQFAISRSDDSRLPPDMEWNDYYVEFGGYFGSYGPHVFAAAPDMLAALRALLAINDDHGPFGGEMYQDGIARAWEQARAAISKATPPEGTRT